MRRPPKSKAEKPKACVACKCPRFIETKSFWICKHCGYPHRKDKPE